MAIDTASAEGFLNQLEIDSAIGAFTLIIDKTQESPPPPTFKDYLGRGIARCLNPVEKGETYTGAIEDLSAAIAFDNTNVEALYYRACAYYVSKFYDRAIADCEKAQDILKNEKNTKKAPFYELLGTIYAAKKDYPKAAENYSKAIQLLLEHKTNDLRIIPPFLFDNYRKVCEKMRDQD
jgi:tetratricopeptide (TPR) repeat protein